MENKQFPLTIETRPGDDSDSYAVVTAHGNLFAHTYSKGDAKMIAAIPRLLAVIDEIGTEAMNAQPELFEETLGIIKLLCRKTLADFNKA